MFKLVLKANIKKAESSWTPITLDEVMTQHPGCTFRVWYRDGVLDGHQIDTVEVVDADGKAVTKKNVLSDPENCKKAEECDK